MEEDRALQLCRELVVVGRVDVGRRQDQEHLRVLAAQHVVGAQQVSDALVVHEAARVEKDRAVSGQAELIAAGVLRQGAVGIRDAEGADVARGEAGEVLVRALRVRRAADDQVGRVPVCGDEKEVEQDVQG